MTQAPVLSATGLTKRFTRGGKRFAAVDDVSFSIASGETFVLIGPSGSGKTTVARLVMRLLTADTGSITFQGHALNDLSGNELRRRRRGFQMVFQDTNASFNPRATVARALSDPLRIHDIVPAPDRPRRIGELLERVGLSPTLAGRAIHEISGGQRQRVAIARAIATDPALIVLDEALSAIDTSLRGDILRLLMDLQRQRSIAYLFITHDLAIARAVGHRLAIMDSGRIVEEGDAVTVIERPRSLVGKTLVAATPRLDIKT